MADGVENPDGGAEEPAKKQRPLDQAVLDIEAARLRGKRMTYRQIGAAMGCSHTTALERVKRAYAADLNEATELARQFERERLDKLWRDADEIANTTYYQTAHGKVVHDPDTGKALVDPGPNLAAIARKQSIAESYRKLGGLDEPTKVEQTGNVTYEVVGLNDSTG